MSIFPETEVEQLPNGKWALVELQLADPNNPIFGLVGGYNVVALFDEEEDARAAQRSWTPRVRSDKPSFGDWLRHG